MAKVIYFSAILFFYDYNFLRFFISAMLDRIKIAKDKRRNNRDNFRMENGYSWDYVLVFRVYDCLDELSEDQKKFSFKYVVNRLAEGGLQTRLFYSMDVSQINVLNSFMACITSSFIG